MGPLGMGEGSGCRLPSRIAGRTSLRSPDWAVASLLPRGSGGALWRRTGGGDGTPWLGKKQCSRPGLGKGRE